MENDLVLCDHCMFYRCSPGGCYEKCTNENVDKGTFYLVSCGNLECCKWFKELQKGVKMEDFGRFMGSRGYFVMEEPKECCICGETIPAVCKESQSPERTGEDEYICWFCQNQGVIE